jgi:HSP20 family molecular chaperone IbpA
LIVFPHYFPQLLKTHFYLGSLFNDIEKVFGSAKLKQLYVYPTDIYNELKDGKVISTVIAIALAGINKDSVKVTVNDDKLHVDILNEIKEGAQGEITRQYIQSQLALRNAHMTWSLNKNVNKENISVEYKDGILSITLPIIEEKEKEPIVLKIN